MAGRTYWKGYLKLSLVTCPVAMMPATSDAEKIRFHTINRETGNRVESRYIDEVTGKVVPENQQARGYAHREGEFIILDDEDLEAVALETTRTIDIEMFVPRGSIPWLYLDKPHYLVPNDEVGEEAFAVIREAMKASQVVGVARLVLYRRERAVLLEPRGKGIVIWTLRYGDEVRDEAGYYGSIPADASPPEKATALARALIKERTRKWSAKMVSDPVQDELARLIESKKKIRTRKSKGTAPPDKADNVVDLFAALRKSLGAGKAKARAAPKA